MFNVHASGGREMMQAAREGAQNAREKHGLRMPKIIGVTVLTSISQQILNTEVRVPGSLEEHVLALAKLSQRSGLDGIVCSAADLPRITHELPPNFLYVTPGIKGPNTEAGSDQKRVMTPYNAIKNGASLLVIGRAIYGAPNPLKAGQEVVEDIVKAL
jgi:orotidine-5'-phosphate decarboxylase